MSEQHLIEALDDCINRLASGQTIDTCLRAYPNLADELHLLLLIGELPRRAHANIAEINAMRTRLDPRIEAKLNTTDFGTSRWRWSLSNLLLLIAILVVLAVGFALLTQGSNGNSVTEIINSPTPKQENSEITTESIEVPIDSVPQVEVTSDNAIGTDDFPVTLEDALEMALVIFPNSTVHNIDMETWDDGHLVWDIELDDALRGVDIDALTGEVLFFGYEVNDDNIISEATDNFQPQSQAEQPDDTRESSSSEGSSRENSERDD